MTFEDFIVAADRYSALGWAVTEQMQALADGEIEGHNANAVAMIREFVAWLERNTDVDCGEIGNRLAEYDHSRV